MARKKKKWYKIISPKIFGSKEIGETITDEPKNLIGRTVNANAKELTGDYKKTHISIKLIINKLEDNLAYTEIKGYKVSRSYLQRFIHKGMSSVNVIHEVESSDGKKLRVKCMITTNGKIQTTKKQLIRKKFKSELEKILSKMTFDNIMFNSTTNRIQKQLVTRLKKTHPLRFVEIKRIDIIKKELKN